MLCGNVGLATSLESLPPAGVSYLKENRATMSSSKERRNSRPQAYSCCVPESESRTFTNGVCEPWKLDEAEQFYLPFSPSHLCEAKPLTKYRERVTMPSGPRTTSSSSWDTAPSTNRANKAKGTQKPSRVRKQLLQRDRRLALLVSLSGNRVKTLFWRISYVPLIKRNKNVSNFIAETMFTVCIPTIKAKIYLSLASVSVIASLMSSQSFSREFSVFWTVWLIVFSTVRHTSSIWFTQRLGCGQTKLEDWRNWGTCLCSEKGQYESRSFTLVGLGM